MHVVVSWDIASTGETRKLAENDLRKVLSPYYSVKPLTTFFVVQVPSADERQRIIQGLTAVADHPFYKLQFVVSPLMQGGAYAGYLPANVWPALNKAVQ